MISLAPPWRRRSRAVPPYVLGRRGPAQAQAAGLRPCLVVHLALLGPCVTERLPFGLDEACRHPGQPLLSVTHPARSHGVPPILHYRLRASSSALNSLSRCPSASSSVMLSKFSNRKDRASPSLRPASLANRLSRR